MATPTDIVNIGLRRIGANRISSMENDTTKEALVARDIYDEARRNLLNTHNWNFAIKRTQLVESTTEPEFGWDHSYVLPEDFVRLISAHPSDSDEGVVEYRLEFQEGEDRVILSDSNELYIRYVFDIQDPNVMSASFRDTLAWQLAREFASALSKSTSAAELADQGYRRALSRAKSIDGVEDYPDRMAEGSWLTSRDG